MRCEHNLNFHSKYQTGVHFRCLGRQVYSVKAHIIAFAQKPDIKDLMIAFTDAKSGKLNKLPVQGLAWIEAPDLAHNKLAISSLVLWDHSPENPYAADGFNFLQHSPAVSLFKKPSTKCEVSLARAQSSVNGNLEHRTCAK